MSVDRLRWDARPDAGPTPAPDAAVAEPDFGATMFDRQGFDDDCKYAVSWTSTPILENTDVFFTVVATTTVDNRPGDRCEHLRRGLPRRPARGSADEPDPRSRARPAPTRSGRSSSTSPGRGPCGSTCTRTARTSSTTRRTVTRRSTSTCRDASLDHGARARRVACAEPLRCIVPGRRCRRRARAPRRATRTTSRR